MNILSIDVWNDGQGGWEWNSWHKVGILDKQEFERIKNEEGYIQWFIINNYVVDKPENLYIGDDGYNIVICDLNTSEPLFAIEYGTEY